MNTCRKQLRVTEVFLSLQGETTFAGLPTAFVRLTGCPLRCGYCDSSYAFTGGRLRTVANILAEVQGYGVRPVTVTGGEPLAQPEVHELLRGLCDSDHLVSLETSGALDVAAVDARVRKILDIKTPGSGEAHRNLWSNLALCGPQDQIKFVICDRVDYEWAKLKCDQWRLPERVGALLFSPSHEELPARTLADWLVADRYPARLQIQLHKHLWGDQPGR